MRLGRNAGLITVAISALLSLLAGRIGFVQGFDGFIHGVSMGRGGPQTSQAPLALVKIDGPTLDAIHDPLVLWPGRFAAVISNLSRAGASVVAVDYIPSTSLEEHAPHLDASLITAINESKARGARVAFGYSEKPGAVLLPHPKYREALSGVGSVDLTPDHGGAVRRYDFCHGHGDGGVDPSLAMTAVYLFSTGEKTLAKLGKDPAWPCGRKPELELVDFRRRIPEESIFSFISILNMKEKGDLARLEERVKGKIVLIGPVSPRLGAHWPIPFNPYEPRAKTAPETIIHLQAMETMLSSAPIQRGEFIDGRLGAMLCAVLISTIMIRYSAIAALLTALGLIGGWAWAVLAEFGQPFAYSAWPPAAGALAAFPAAGLYVYLREARLRDMLSRRLKSYVNEEVVENILSAHDAGEIEGKMVYATVMFADIRSFTAISEKLDPRQVVAGLNRYFEEMTAAITESGGQVNKYMGDGILAIFGAPKYDPGDGALAAAWASVKMLKAVERLNRQAIFPGFPEIRMGVGMHSGEAIVGNIGCAGKMDYSIIGDTVNTAARIEGLTKDYGTPILMSEEFFRNLGGKAEAVHLGTSLVKGKTKRIHIYTLKAILNQLEMQAINERNSGAAPIPNGNDARNNEEPMDSTVKAGD